MEVNGGATRFRNWTNPASQIRNIRLDRLSRARLSLVQCRAAKLTGCDFTIRALRMVLLAAAERRENGAPGRKPGVGMCDFRAPEGERTVAGLLICRPCGAGTPADCNLLC